MAIAAYQRDAGLCRALFRTNDMDNALAFVEQRDQRHIEFGAISQQGLKLDARQVVLNPLTAPHRWNDMVWHREHCVGAAHRAPAYTHTLEPGPARDLMSEVHVDV